MTNEEEKRQAHENIINHIYVNHISQLEKDMIGIKKEQEFQGRDLSALKTLVHELIEKVAEGVGLARRTYWLLVGGGFAFAIIFAGIKFLIPLLQHAN